MRMCLFVGFFQALGTDVGIDLGGRQTFMSQKFLDGSKVGTAIEHVCGEGMPECVRRCQFIEAGQHQIFFQHPSDASRRESGPKSIEEHGIVIFGTGIWLLLPDFQPAVKGLGGVSTNRCDPLFLPFSEDADDVGVPIPVGDVQANQFRHSEPCGI